VAGPGVDHNSYVHVNGDTATVHIDMSVGGPLGLGVAAPAVRADFTVKDLNGDITISGSHTQFPSFEACSYGQSGHALNMQYTETPENQLGPLLLTNGENTSTDVEKKT
jgi:hypothetical protein